MKKKKIDYCCIKILIDFKLVFLNHCPLILSVLHHFLVLYSRYFRHEVNISDCGE